MEMIKKHTYGDLVYLLMISASIIAFVANTSGGVFAREQLAINIEKRKPSVYLSYVGKGEIYENCSAKRQVTYELKLHNNSPYRINIDANSDLDSSTKKRIILSDGKQKE
jgi:hypothetical protein